MFTLPALSQGAEDVHRPSLTLTPNGIKTLQSLVRDDSEAKPLFAEIRSVADEALSASPAPVPEITTEGKLATDPARIQTWKALGDMPKILALAYAYAVTSDSRYAEKARAFVVAWATTCQPKGNPINDTNLEPLIVAFDLTKATYSPADRDAVEKYLRAVYAAEVRTSVGPSHTNVNNWNSHRLKIDGLIAFTLHDAAMIEQVTAAYRRQVEVNLKSDGSSIDFEDRDALHYHEYDTTPLLALALAARNNGVDLYAYESPTGSSLKKSVAWFLPYETGEKTHADFVHSNVDFDRKRAAAGQKEYAAGHLWNPHGGLPTVERAELWEPALLPLIAKLAGSEAKRFPTWQTLLNAAVR